MDSKKGYAAESSAEKAAAAAAKAQDSGREAARCPQGDDSTMTWPKSKSPGHGKDTGRVRKRGEYQDGEEEKARLAWALKNWPTRDIPIPSIEAPDKEAGMPEDPAAPKRQKRTPVDKFEVLWHYLENNTPDMRSPTLFPSLSPASDLDDLPRTVDSDTSFDSSLLTETIVPVNDGEITHCA